MLARLFSFLLLAPIALVFADIQISSATLSGGALSIAWSSAVGDPTAFSIQVVQADGLIVPYGIANNIQTSQGGITIALPTVPPASGYTVRFISTDNVALIYAESAPFTVTAADLTAVVNPSTFPTITPQSTRPASSTTGAVTSSVVPIATRPTTATITPSVTVIRATDSVQTTSAKATTSTPAATTTSAAFRNVASSAFLGGVLVVTGLLFM